MTDLLAYALREEYAGTVVQYDTLKDQEAGNGTEVPVYTGGVIAAGDRDVDVRELLDGEPHPGVILVNPTDTALANALEDYPALKRVSAEGLNLPDDVEPLDELDSRTVAQLREIAKAEDLEGASRANKPALITAIRAKRAAAAAALEPDATDEDLLRASELDTVDAALDHADTTTEGE